MTPQRTLRSRTVSARRVSARRVSARRVSARTIGPALALALAVSVSASACYGTFTLTKKLHTWNGQVSDSKFVQELVFLGFIILPVYSLSLLGDGLIFNTIEFWTGDNPVASRDDVRIETYAHGVRVLVPDRPALRLERIGDGTVSIWSEDQLLGHARFTEDGGLVLLDPERGRSLAFEPEQIAQLRTALEPPG